MQPFSTCKETLITLDNNFVSPLSPFLETTILLSSLSFWLLWVSHISGNIHCPFVTELFDLMSSRLTYVSEILSFLRFSEIPFLFNYSSTNEYLDCFFILIIVSDLLWTWVNKYSSKTSFQFLRMYTQMRNWWVVGCLFFIFWRTAMLFLSTAVSLNITTNNTQGYLFLPILANAYNFLFCLW